MQAVWNEFKTGGFRGLFRRYGWKVVAGVLIYYIIRDLFLYVFLPMLLLTHF